MPHLLLARHGEATENLTDQGKLETAFVGQQLAKLPFKLDLIYHSEKARAKETAEILQSKIDPKVTLQERANLKPNDEIAEIVDEIYSTKKNILVVTHLPFLEKLVSALLFYDERALPFDFCPSSVFCLTGSGESWQLSWMVTPKVALEP